MSEEMQTCPSCGELVPTEYVVCVWCGFDLTAEQIRRAGIKIGRREAFNRARKVITDPRQAFREITLIPDYTGGRWILYLLGLVMTLNMLAVFRKLEGLAFNNIETNIVLALSSSIQISIPLRFILNLSFLIVQPLVLYLIFFIVWRWSGRILLTISRSVGGKGDRETIRAVVAYSLVPILLGWTAAWLIRLISPREQASSLNYAAVEEALLNVAERGFGIVAVIFLYVGWLWATGLAVIGMRQAAKLSWVEAALVAGLPFLLFMTIAL